MTDLYTITVISVIYFISCIYASSVGSGSLLVLPAMLFMGVPATITVATNRMARLFSSSYASKRFLDKIKITQVNLKEILIATAVGTIAGAMFVISISEALLKTIVIAFVVFAGLFVLLFNKKGLKESKPIKIKGRRLIDFIFYSTNGFYRVIAGTAAGTFVRIYSIVVDGTDFLQASTIASVLSAFAALIPTIIFIYYGLIDYPLAISMVVFGIIGTHLGTKLAIEKGNVFIQKLFVIISFALIGKLLFFP